MKNTLPDVAATSLGGLGVAIVQTSAKLAAENRAATYPVWPGLPWTVDQLPSAATGAAAVSGVGVGVGVGDGSGVGEGVGTGVGVGVGVGEGAGAGATMTPPEPLAPLPPSPPPQALTRNSNGRLTNADFFMCPRMLRAIILMQRCSKCRKHGKRPVPPRLGHSRTQKPFPIADLRSAMHPNLMEHAHLADFLTGTLSPEALIDEITTEVNACNAAVRAGANGYIIITDGPAIEVTREGARRLLAAIVEKRLPFELANYVADCLIMSDDFYFADCAVRDAVHSVEDDSRAPTKDETIEALAMLG